ncbi:hypothetical protein AAHA92_16940 [Salvia divinorum]|uniref:Uncharacterized protein n=1 Tax=Salvia divinorum TaxID=28513 RepID=A0ABD1GX77_SALDI
MRLRDRSRRCCRSSGSPKSAANAASLLGALAVATVSPHRSSFFLSPLPRSASISASDPDSCHAEAGAGVSVQRLSLLLSVPPTTTFHPRHVVRLPATAAEIAVIGPMPSLSEGSWVSRWSEISTKRWFVERKERLMGRANGLRTGPRWGCWAGCRSGRESGLVVGRDGAVYWAGLGYSSKPKADGSSLRPPPSSIWARGRKAHYPPSL